MQVESLGRYRIERELGSGAMGRVFLAYDPQIDRQVAIKTVQIFASLPEADRVQARERFLREARSAGKLLHPGLVTIFDVGETDGVPYLAMEFVEGETLEAFCREEGLLAVPEVVALIAAAAEALAFAHERGIIHRDIKPANLMRVGDGAVKIMDFGLAKSAATSVTHDGALFGTPNYMSPEQVRGDSLDGRSDLFSLGVVAYEMLTGVKPFAGDSVSSVLYRIVHEPPQDEPLRLDRIAAPLAEFLERALAKNRDSRFSDGAAFSAALRRAGRATASGRLAPALIEAPRADAPLAVGPPSIRAPEAAVKRGSRPRLPWIVASAVALAVLGWAAHAFLGAFAPRQSPMLEARVRTEPEGVPVRLNGSPLGGNRLQFAKEGPFGVLTASQGCRDVKHRIEVADAGTDIVLVLDAAHASVSVDPGVPGARLAVNGREAGKVPVALDLDLCRDNVLAIEAEGYRPNTVTIPAKSTPLDARNATSAIRLEVIPTGRIVLPETRFPVLFFIDGKPALRTAGGVQLPAGSHVVRASNEERFLDVSMTVDLPAGGTATPALAIPALARLVVQTFPPDCRVALKRPGSEWRQVGDAPLHYELAAGRYTLRVESPQTGASREMDVALAPGVNAPVRISFGRPER